MKSGMSGKLITALFCLQQLASVLAYDLVKDYSGTSFFDEWDFYGHWDNLTLGDVNWLDRANATAKQLAYVNSAGNAILKVDTGEVKDDDKRDTVRITSQREYPVGTIWITDIVHMPFGCSVWPAIWTKGPLWPDDGEIDIIEGINLNQNNQMALHTKTGCSHADPAPSNQRGKSGQLDCSIDAGCTVIETAANSFGDGFNKAGGGVYATQFDASGVNIWFWTRASIPKSITSATSTSAIESLADWGPPTASYPSGATCDISKSFGTQSLVIDITLCGNWAGAPEIYSAQCASQGPTGLCYKDNVRFDGSKYANAYFEISYVRAYSTPGSLAAVLPTTTTNSPKTNPTSNGSTGINDTAGSGAGESFSVSRRTKIWGGVGAAFAGVLALL